MKKKFGKSSKSNQYFLYRRRWFLIFFCILIVKKITFKIPASMKTLTNSGDFTGSSITLSNSGGTSKRNGNHNTAFETADSQSSACGFEKEYRNQLHNFLNFPPPSPA
jgi:hypothetical protein